MGWVERVEGLSSREREDISYVVWSNDGEILGCEG